MIASGQIGVGATRFPAFSGRISRHACLAREKPEFRALMKCPGQIWEPPMPERKEWSGFALSCRIGGRRDQAKPDRSRAKARGPRRVNPDRSRKTATREKAARGCRRQPLPPVQGYPRPETPARHEPPQVRVKERLKRHCPMQRQGSCSLRRSRPSGETVGAPDRCPPHRGAQRHPAEEPSTAGGRRSGKEIFSLPIFLRDGRIIAISPKQ